MKGLLLKDWYMMQKYCKSYLLIAAVFLTVSIWGNNNLFFVFYPCLLCGMIPVNLLAYDERSRWMQYSCTMPYTKAQIVSGKYLIGLFSQLAVMAATALVQGIKGKLSGSFIPGDFAMLMLLMLVISAMASSITLPFVFKLGVEKGRLAYYVMIGFVCAASYLAATMMESMENVEVPEKLLFLCLTLVAAVLYLLSWALSIRFFSRREIA